MCAIGLDPVGWVGEDVKIALFVYLCSVAFPLVAFFELTFI